MTFKFFDPVVRGLIPGAGNSQVLRGLCLASLLVLSPISCAHAAAPPSKTCDGGDVEVVDLTPGVPQPDLLVTGDCKVKTGQKYFYGAVNIVKKSGSPKSGNLIFDENYPANATKKDIEFWASSILVEKDGALTALNSGSSPRRYGQSGGVLAIYLYGKNESVWDPNGGDPTGGHDGKNLGAFSSQNAGAVCMTGKANKDDPPPADPCGIPSTTWNTNGTSPAAMPFKVKGADFSDYFYKYGPLYGDGRCTNKETWTNGACPNNGDVGYFGNKVLGVSYGGTLDLAGYKGASDGIDNDHTNSGVSWMRLEDGKDLSAGASDLYIERDPAGKWKSGDEIVITSTDYLPGHSEKFEIAKGYTGGTNIPLVGRPVAAHNGTRYGGPKDQTNSGNNHWSKRFPDRIKKSIDPDYNDLVANGAETRAAVALLTRSIRILSAGDVAGAYMPRFEDVSGNPCKDDGQASCYSYGAHLVIRQGALGVRVSGVEFKMMGQGGRLGHYPVHFHMARQTADNTFIKDSVVNESMTRWYVVHSTLGVTLSRNIGYMSIGHGYYLEAGSETDNNFYSNLGVMARAAVVNKQNPRHVPGILADNQDPKSFIAPNVANEGFPYRSDNENPTVFWITNGWNDFIGNMAAGAGACGSGYWLVPSLNSDMPEVPNGEDTYLKWSGYSLLQKAPAYGGATPLKSFYKNYATSSMHSFQTTSDAPNCNDMGVYAAEATPINSSQGFLKEVQSTAPRPLRQWISGNNPYSLQNNSADAYYPHVIGGARRATKCPIGSDNKPDCRPEAVPVCASPDPNNQIDPSKQCTVTVLDHFTSSYHWANGNVSAIWLRPQWYLFDHSVLSDVQNGGLTFVSGGDYTKSSVIDGYWALSKDSVFIGNTRSSDFGFSRNTGPFNNTSKLHCDGVRANYCLSAAEGITMPVGDFFTNQRLANIYDGPSYQDTSVYLDTKVADCPLSGWNSDCMYGNESTILLLRKSPGVNDGKCYIPNAAVGWKQPNGFLYPPAFHMTNTFFDKVDFRHFVIDPLVQAPQGVPSEENGYRRGGTYLTDTTAMTKQYCANRPNAFDTWTSIDRQTELNDDDGSLTGLSNSRLTPIQPGVIDPLKQTISINEDTFFGAPIDAPECGSALGPNAAPANACSPLNLSQMPPTARTSPYDYLMTVVYRPPSGSGELRWDSNCTTQSCYGVPLYRQYLTGMTGRLATATGEWALWVKNGCDSNPAAVKCRWPFIRMAGADFAQRETLTINNGLYYIDTTKSTTAQSSNAGAEKYTNLGSSFLNVFEANKTYNVFFVYAKKSTVQTYQIYVGRDFTADLIKGIRVNIATKALGISAVTPSPWLTLDPSAVPTTGILTVRVNFSSVTDLTPTAEALCKPRQFCKVKTGAPSVCETALTDDDPLVIANPKFKAEAEYACKNWAVKDLDCPLAGCYGFSFTLPPLFVADDTYHRPTPVPFPQGPSPIPQGSPDWRTIFERTNTLPDKSAGGSCYYPKLPGETVLGSDCNGPAYQR